MAGVDLQAVDEEGLAGRALVSFAPAPGREPGGAQIGAGSLVRVVQRREVPEDAPTGIVARRTRGRIAVAFDQPPPDWVTDGRVALELLPSPVTYERLAGAVRGISDATRWHGPLRGEPLRFREAPGPRLEHRLNPEQERYTRMMLTKRSREFLKKHESDVRLVWRVWAASTSAGEAIRQRVFLAG